jgi:hypothetical protein
MKSRQIDQSPITFILVFETGDALAKGLLEFADRKGCRRQALKPLVRSHRYTSGGSAGRASSMNHRSRSTNRWNSCRSLATSP